MQVGVDNSIFGIINEMGYDMLCVRYADNENHLQRLLSTIFQRRTNLI